MHKVMTHSWLLSVGKNAQRNLKNVRQHLFKAPWFHLAVPIIAEVNDK